MSEEKLQRLDKNRCPDHGTPLTFVRPASAGMAAYECPDCGQTFHLSTDTENHSNQ